jgi:hypothetical protein
MEHIKNVFSMFPSVQEKKNTTNTLNCGYVRNLVYYQNYSLFGCGVH